MDIKAIRREANKSESEKMSMLESMRKAMANAPDKFFNHNSELYGNDEIHDSTLRPARSRYGDIDSENLTDKSRKLFPNRVMKG